MPQEEIEKKTCDLAIQSTKLTARALVAGLQTYLQYTKQKDQVPVPGEEKVCGKQTVDQLIGQNQGASSLPIGNTGLKSFERIAKKYGVDFAVVKNKTEDPAKYVVFFKARDVDALKQVLAEYTEKQLRKAKHPKKSVRKKLEKYKEQTKKQPKKVREKKKVRER